MATVLLCPWHSEAEHAPQVARLTPDAAPLHFGCLCGSWTVVEDSLGAGLTGWQEHVRKAVHDQGLDGLEYGNPDA